MSEREKQDELRSQLLALDKDLLRLLEKRARLGRDVSAARPTIGKFAPATDAVHMAELERAVQPPVSASALRPIFRAIDAACHLADASARVAFIGAEGGFGWAAAKDYFGPHAELVRLDTVAGALEDVVRSRAEFAVLAYESMKDGPIFHAIEAITARDLKLVGEREVSQVLALVNKSGDPDKVERVYVSAQDHVACVQYLEANHPRAMVLDVRSPIMAWELASENDANAAVIPRDLAATIPMKIAKENVGDDGEVRIRYAIVSKLPAPRTGADSTALLFSANDRPGALHDILEHFKERECNLLKIQSRPVHDGREWQYLFYVEVSGHVTDRQLVSALEGVKRATKMLKIVGSFPLERLSATHEATPESRKR